MKNRPVSAIILGAGHRSMTYANYALSHPEKLRIVGVADPDPFRRKLVMEKFGFSEEFCFENAEELAKVPKFADAVINGTMDEQHVETSVPVLERGYDMLLEKPFSVNKDEMEKLLDCVRKNGSKVMICHVLRYTPFYLTIKKLIAAGRIGEIINIQTAENVSYHHLSTSYVRGKWANSKKCHTSMLLAKCCHDIDIMMWMMSPDKPVSVSSFGSKFQFREENAPEGAADRCLDCKYVDTCRYSSKKLYLENPDRWEFYVWRDLENIESPTDKDREDVIRRGEYGRCIYKCDNDVVDHQSVLVNFASGATGTHNMTGGSAESLRTIRVTGTKGEIYGEFENDYINIKTIAPAPGRNYDEETLDLSNAEAEGHGGGDENLIADFIDFQRGESHSVSCTSVFDSVAGHEVIFLADESREENGAVKTVKLS